MKTYNFSTGNILLKSIVGLLGLISVSCGTYQNKSYYDNDGIYGSQRQETGAVSTDTKDSNVSEANQKYKEYFGSNANNYSDDQSESFTDVENYSSTTNQNQGEDSDSNYGAWGTNTEHVTINVYDNSWGWGGYNYGYWGNYWGYRPWRTGIYLGWNSWDYGWSNPYWGYSGYYGPSWGWYNPYYYGGYYGYNNHWNNGYYYGNDYVYNRGRRGSAYNGNRYSTENNSTNNYAPRRRGSSLSPRSNDGFQNPRPAQPPRKREVRPEGSSENTFYNTPRPRPNTESVPRPRTESGLKTREFSSPPRSNPSNNTPRPRSESSSPRSSYESPRSSSSSGSNSGSFSGGGRSGGRRG